MAHDEHSGHEQMTDDSTAHGHHAAHHDPTAVQASSEGQPQAVTDDHAATHTDHSAHHGHEMGAADTHQAHTDHSGHELLFRNRFWVCLILSIPVLLYSPCLLYTSRCV